MKIIFWLTKYAMENDLPASKLKKLHRFINKLEIISAGGYEAFQRTLTPDVEKQIQEKEVFIP